MPKKTCQEYIERNELDILVLSDIVMEEVNRLMFYLGANEKPSEEERHICLNLHKNILEDLYVIKRMASELYEKQERTFNDIQAS